jgi:hypothetical protein
MICNKQQDRFLPEDAFGAIHDTSVMLEYCTGCKTGCQFETIFCE